MTFTLAHLSDVHLGPLKWPGPRALMSKRLFGYLHWLRSRQAIHQRPSVEALTLDLAEQAPDHIAVTGDLVNIGLPAEFEAALDWLRVLGPPEQVSVAPGNHDAYVRIKHAQGIGRWAPYMAPNAEGAKFAEPGENGFPYVRVFGHAALVGLSTAIPTRPFRAHGRLGVAQLEDLAPILRALHLDGLYRVVLLHHPPLPCLAGPRRGLKDAEALVAVLKAEGAELILYGHDHIQLVTRMKTATGVLTAVCVPSASASVSGPKPLARYNLFEIGRSDDGWTCAMTGRGLLAPRGPVVEIEKVAITA